MRTSCNIVSCYYNSKYLGSRNYPLERPVITQMCAITHRLGTTGLVIDSDSMFERELLILFAEACPLGSNLKLRHRIGGAKCRLLRGAWHFRYATALNHCAIF